MATQHKEPILFVSHHSSKLDTAEHVERALKAKGVSCWIAPRDVDPGEPFDRAVRKAIAETDAMLLLFCSKSEKSRHVKRELILADQLGKAIIPLRLEKIDPGELSYHLADSQWIDWLEQRDGVIDRIAAKARDFQLGDGFDPSPPVVDRSINAAEADHFDSTSPLSFEKPAAPPPPLHTETRPQPPVQPVSPASGAPHHGAAIPPRAPAFDPPPGTPPHHQEPASPGGGSKWIWLALGGLILLALIGTAIWYFALRESPDRGEAARAVDERWFAGRWSPNDECETSYNFKSNGHLVAPDDSRGTWSIRNGNELVIEWEDDETERREIARVGEDEISSSVGPAYRCR